MSELLDKAKKIKKASEILKKMNAAEKNKTIMEIAKEIKKNKDYILKENQKDVLLAEKKGLKKSLVDRLVLNEKRIQGMINACNTVINLKDPVGEIFDSFLRDDGLRISKVRVPLGVIGIIYESRPNVTLEATILSLKSGNTVLLRGGSDAINSNKAIVKTIKSGLKKSNIPESVIEIIEDTNRDIVNEMLKLNDYIDLIIPRGGKGLIDFVVKNATVPVLETGVGICHIFVDESADIKKSIDIIDNAKTQRPGTCNTVETVLIHKNIAEKILPGLKNRLEEKNVEIRGCEETLKIINVKKATEEDWKTEYLDLILSIKIVNEIDEAINHIKTYSTGHSESILTENYFNAMKFINEIDSAAVYINASTRFTDGGEFGLGAEMGISTQKMHARGPVGLKELTTYKYLIFGNYNVRE
ncbi:glutamate-5-semialdehyde dehydrogenase [Marinitoga hydrogenitolerans DSM 16785]|uniref:Gamma-glutamyl phosphate reductase n=1 Tax=Marinitoga hydrogenitolerans (strain DSM 16785 / JCM 12826 / AT1271) TaxID=1122195 RepID=A0A1M4X9D7_MARH1|nr:glutamate-5-semialdehyde dehydrogenase [Marinitoga hydrogenitolerans]SHE90124.1 glutamate-5-semialdehyde dehydrogenase [Marinitoga hydrogenitolerans DSM 16785]